MRRAIAEVLSLSFEVVAAVADGHQAVEATRQLDPDVVVLDVSMPMLDGFGAARELVGRGTRAKLLFLSVHDADRYVAAAIDAGGQGYVAKPRLVTDLEDAIAHVLQGRLRLPSPSSLLGLADPRARHAAHFYADDDSRLHVLHTFVGRALRRGDTVVAIARPALVNSLTSLLADDGEGFDVESLAARGRYQTLDAEQCVSRAIRGGTIDEAAVVKLIHSIEDAHAASTTGEPGNLVVFGECAPLLLEQGDVRGALTLEHIWHRHSGGFQTLCFYRHAVPTASHSPDAIDQFYAAHQTISA